MNQVLTTSSESVTFSVDKGWSLINPNTEILAVTLLGMISILAEVAGFWPKFDLPDLIPNDEYEKSSNYTHVEELYPEFKNSIYKFSEVIKTAEMYTVHIYLVTYILLPYPVITEKQKVLLTPWLICGVLRSLLLGLLTSLAGIALCAVHPTLCYSCLQFSAWRAVEFCMSIYSWTSVHNFYYFLDRRSPVQEVEKVIQSINRARQKNSLAETDSSHSSTLLSLDSINLEDIGADASLVERAAMAWIAREILENGDDYVTDAQFSQFLALKATMELRQIVNEIAEKKKEERRKAKKLTVKERINESLDFYNRVGKQEPNAPIMKLEAFEQSKDLSRRDPIRKIPPLTPFVTGQSPKNNVPDSLGSQLSQAHNLDPSSPEKEVEVQTDPLSPEMIRLFDMLEAQQEKRRLSKRRSKCS